MQSLFHAWLRQPLVSGTCAACGRSSTEQFCSQRCTGHFETLRAFGQKHMALGHPGKRLLDPSQADLVVWEAVPDDVVVSLLLVSYPWAHRNAHQFQALALWRHVSRRFRLIVDERIFTQMQRLPRAFNAVAADTAVMRLFPNLRRVVWPPEEAVLPVTLEKLAFWIDMPLAIMSQMLQRAVTLTQLDLTAVIDCPLTNGVLAGLTNLTRLRLLTRGSELTGGQDLSTLTRLSRLAVQRNFDASALVYVTRLQLLDNAYEPGVTPDVTLLALTRVTHLTLGRLRDVDNATLAQLTQLTYLDAGELRLNDDGLQPLTRLRHLRAMHSEGIGNATLCGLPIETLDLGGVNQIMMPIRELAPAQQLRRLKLTGYHGVSDVALGELTQLTDLEIHKGYFRAGSLAQLTRLQRLYLGVELDYLGAPDRERVALREKIAAPLRSLGLANQTFWEWTMLTQLTELNVGVDTSLSVYYLENLTNLQRLVVADKAMLNVLGAFPLLTELDLRPLAWPIDQPPQLKLLPPRCLVRANGFGHRRK